MNLTKEISGLILRHETHCEEDRCQKLSRELSMILMESLADSKVAGFEYSGESKLNPFNTSTRPNYEIVHEDGRRLKMAFTGMTTYQVFSRRRRSTHCYPGEFKKRVEKFLA